ncbi:MAG: OsmC family protein [Gemmatimonadaceae bacterium]
MAKTHDYTTRLKWDGNLGQGTSTYAGYDRNYVVAIDGKSEMRGSADPMFRGDGSLHNPEDLFIAAIAACHMLTYLALCAKHGIVVTAYEDRASGTLELAPDGGGKFTRVTLVPSVTITQQDREQEALSLHDDAHKLCFIAQSSSVPIDHAPTVKVESG